MESKRIRLMQGNEACVEGAIAAGMRFFAGYPITPSTEIAELSAEKLPKIGGRFIQMEDEIASMGAIIGASLAGLKSMTATSGPGFSLKQENLGYAAITEVPCVVVNVQRGGPSTGLPTAPAQGDVMQAKWGTHGDHPVIALTPSSVRETFDLTIKAFNFSEKYRTPVILLMDEVIGHLREKIEIPDLDNVEIIDRKKPNKETVNYKAYEVLQGEIVPRMAAFGDGHRFHVTGLVHDETGFPSGKSDVAEKLITRLVDKVEENKDDISLYEEFHLEDAETVVIAYGGTARSAKRAVELARNQGLKVGLFKPITIWPFLDNQIIELSKNVKNIIVAEMNLGQYVIEVERVASKYANIHRYNRVHGELISPDEILTKIKEVY
ncbi:2-oxoglutarate ferredoxin oxidoreductase, alpha subunit [Proteiniborus ethanoligenes]|uniref:2-oxoglutarate ferredoxin oxidoreductase, alpha subunit n=1 Tax=Proteiniborus ethanoligenes TaxID=415015 RepID=A0A1H3NCE2_9FIRM|nr:2-oxoacid:acceptor oxidoreductase subunit alpha [Proteiniborus ethanoligenes]TAH61726.1 MAG: 2-oxoacid:acceptor oxidoreductase subunit alpha [Gottschalkiaceae bacterium]SDY86125.1 2-oxoglutarate ferredoxin oxidoreductase, alpha subunit [Proteiniborus ethanoligenes]